LNKNKKEGIEVNTALKCAPGQLYDSQGSDFW